MWFRSIGDCPLTDIYPLTEPDLINPYKRVDVLNDDGGKEHKLSLAELY